MYEYLPKLLGWVGFIGFCWLWLRMHQNSFGMFWGILLMPLGLIYLWSHTEPFDVPQWPQGIFALAIIPLSFLWYCASMEISGPQQDRSFNDAPAWAQWIMIHVFLYKKPPDDPAN